MWTCWSCSSPQQHWAWSQTFWTTRILLTGNCVNISVAHLLSLEQPLHFSDWMQLSGRNWRCTWATRTLPLQWSGILSYITVYSASMAWNGCWNTTRRWHYSTYCQKLNHTNNTAGWSVTLHLHSIKIKNYFQKYFQHSNKVSDPLFFENSGALKDDMILILLPGQKLCLAQVKQSKGSVRPNTMKNPLGLARNYSLFENNIGPEASVKSLRNAVRVYTLRKNIFWATRQRKGKDGPAANTLSQVAAHNAEYERKPTVGLLSCSEAAPSFKSGFMMGYHRFPVLNAVMTLAMTGLLNQRWPSLQSRSSKALDANIWLHLL